MRSDRTESGIAHVYIIMFIIFAVFAGGIYYAYISYQERQEKLAHEEAMRKEETRRKNEEFLINQERKRIAAENEARKKILDDAASYARINIDTPHKALARLNEAKDKLKGTEYEVLASAEIDNFNNSLREKTEAKKKKIDEMLADLDARAAELSKKKQFQEAIAVFNDYEGKFQQETAAKRSAMAKKYEKRLLEYEKIQQKAEEKLSEISAVLAEGNFQTAYEKLSVAEKDKSLEEYRNEINSMKNSLDKIKNLDKELQTYFESKINTPINITTTNKQKFEGTITTADRNSVELKIKIDKLTASKKIPYSSIPLSEKRRILKEIDGTAAELMLCASAVKKGDMKLLANCSFSSTGKLGKSLDRQIQKKVDSNETPSQENPKKPTPAKDDDETESPAKTVLDKNTIKALKIKALVQKPSSNSGSDYDNRFQIVRSRINISNEGLADADGLEGEIFVIGKSVSGSKDYRIFKIAKTTGINVPKGKKYTSEEFICKVEYDSNDYAKFGHKYEGYLLIMKDSSGEIFMKKGYPSKFERIADKITKLEENSLFDDDGNFIEMYRYRY